MERIKRKHVVIRRTRGTNKKNKGEEQKKVVTWDGEDQKRSIVEEHVVRNWLHFWLLFFSSQIFTAKFKNGIKKKSLWQKMNCQSSVPGVGLENAYRSNLLWSIFEKNYKRKKFKEVLKTFKKKVLHKNLRMIENVNILLAKKKAISVISLECAYQ